MKCLVTGAGGFIGGHLVEHLAAQGHRVHALSRKTTSVLRAMSDRIVVGEADITNPVEVAACVDECLPDQVFHLAAQSLPSVSWEQPGETFAVNVNGSLNLLEALRERTPEALVVVACSSAEYEAADGGDPLPEEARLGPASPYGVSKMAVDHITRLYGECYGMRTIRVRPFFLTGPRKVGDVSSDLARRVVAVERGEAEDVAVGNTEIIRDILDIRDGLRALDVIANEGEAGEVYNICSGRGYRIREILDRLKGFARVEVRERTDAALIRPVDEMVKVGDPGRLKKLGWEPKRSLDDTLESILAYWRAQEPTDSGT